jgi:hypothetical protein
MEKDVKKKTDLNMMAWATEKLHLGKKEERKAT